MNKESFSKGAFVEKIIFSRFPALGYKNFRYFLSGQCISLMGTWVQKTAQQWIVYELTKSPFILGIVGVCQFTPMLVFSLFAGAFVDRFPKRKFLVVTQSLEMIQAFIMFVLIWSGHIKYWHIFILAGFLGMTHTFDMPTRQSFFIELVGKEDLINAIGLNSTIVNSARIIGPAFAAFLLSFFGAALCFLINGLSFIAVIIGLLNIKNYNVNIRKQDKNIMSDIKDGLKYVFSSNILSSAVVSMLVIGTLAMNNDIIIPVFAKEVLKKGAAGYGVLLSAMGAGSLVGSLFFSLKKGSGFDSKSIFRNALILCLCLIIISLLNNYYLAFLLIFVLGFFNINFMAMVNSTVQLNSNDKYRGRTMGVYTLVLLGSTPIGNFFTGIIMQKFGANIGFFWDGFLGAVFITMLILKMHIKH